MLQFYFVVAYKGRCGIAVDIGGGQESVTCSGVLARSGCQLSPQYQQTNATNTQSTQSEALLVAHQAQFIRPDNNLETRVHF